MSKLCILQNKAIKLVCDGKKSDHLTSYYSKLSILKLQGLYELGESQTVFGFSREHFSPALQELFLRHPKYLFATQAFQQTSTIYKYLDIQLPIQKSIKYEEVKIWNKISSNLKN